MTPKFSDGVITKSINCFATIGAYTPEAEASNNKINPMKKERFS